MTEPVIFVVDDDDAARESVCAFIEAIGYKATAFPSGEEFLAKLSPDTFGCLVTDYKMPGMDALDIQEHLVESGVSLPIIVVSGYADVPTAVRLMKRGALTLLEKPYQDQELAEAIAEALAKERKQRSSDQERQVVVDRYNTLTDDEPPIMRMLIGGVPNKAIASRLNLGLRTVERRRQRILQKVAVQSVPELAIVITAFGLNEQEEEPEAKEKLEI